MKSKPIRKMVFVAMTVMLLACILSGCASSVAGQTGGDSKTATGATIPKYNGPLSSSEQIALIVNKAGVADEALRPSRLIGYENSTFTSDSGAGSVPRQHDFLIKSIFDYQYDDKGRLVATARHDCIASNKEPEVHIYEYSDNDELVYEEIRYPNGKSGYSSIEYADNRVTKCDVVGENHETTMSYSYDEDSNTLTIDVVADGESDYSVVTEYDPEYPWNGALYEYDYGHKLKESRFDEGGRLEQVSVWTYDERGDAVQAEAAKYSTKGKLGTTQVETYEHDSHHNLTLRYLDQNDPDAEYGTRYKYVYDRAGKLSSRQARKSFDVSSCKQYFFEGDKVVATLTFGSWRSSPIVWSCDFSYYQYGQEFTDQELISYSWNMLDLSDLDPGEYVTTDRLNEAARGFVSGSWYTETSNGGGATVVLNENGTGEFDGVAGYWEWCDDDSEWATDTLAIHCYSASGKLLYTLNRNDSWKLRSISSDPSKGNMVLKRTADENGVPLFHE